MDDAEVDGSMIRIHSRPILKALRRFVSYWPDKNLTGYSISIFEPYSIIFHHLDQLVAYQATYQTSAEASISSPQLLAESETCDENTHQHIQVLRDFLDNNHQVVIMEEQLRHCQTPAVATYPMLWMLLKPGVTVFTKIERKLAACVISHVDYEPNVFRNSGAYHLQLWYLDFDGRYVGRRNNSATVVPFAGEMNISSLDVVPADIFDKEDGGGMRRQLEERGEKWYNLLTPRLMHYKGDSFGTNIRWARLVILTEYSLQIN